jgi:hypothetical protein
MRTWDLKKRPLKVVLQSKDYTLIIGGLTHHVLYLLDVCTLSIFSLADIVIGTFVLVLGVSAYEIFS